MTNKQKIGVINDGDDDDDKINETREGLATPRKTTTVTARPYQRTECYSISNAAALRPTRQLDSKTTRSGTKDDDDNKDDNT